MTEQEIRRALEACKREDQYGVGLVGVNEYAATLRALLEARALLKRSIGTHYECVMSEEECGECQKVRAFLAEGE